MPSPIIFDQYQRYRFIQEIILAVSKGRAGRILEVGSFGSPLKKLLPHHNVLELDLDQKDPAVDVIGTGLRLPFSSQTFDVVVSTDVLEHMNFNDRGAFIKELVRVASGYLILGFPHANPLNSQADNLFLEFIRNYSGCDFDFLKEHERFGLPDEDQVRKLVESLFPEVLEIKNGNVHSWVLMQLANFILMQNPALIKVHDLFTDFFNQSLETLSHAPPNYRTFLVGSHHPFSTDVKAVFEKRMTVPDPGPVQGFAAQSFALISAAEAVIREKTNDLEAERLKTNSLAERIDNREAEIEELNRRMHSQELKIKNLEDYLNLFLQHPAYKVFKFLKKPVDPA